LCLAEPECRFAVLRENARDRFVEQLFYFRVQVDERTVQPAREGPTNRRLSYAWEADQDEVRRWPRR